MNDRAVLVVDDDPNIRDLMQLVLETELGIEPVLAGDGLEALELMADHWLPALVVSDVMMPRLDGVELVRRLRQCPATSHIRILVVAASKARRAEAMAVGGDDYLDKPFELDALVGKVRKCLAAS